MALTYEESAALTTDLIFRGRIKVAAVKFASYIQNEAVNTPRHAAGLRWAQRVYGQPDIVAAELQPPVVLDPAVQEAGAGITDEQLQIAVEGVANKVM